MGVPVAGGSGPASEWLERTVRWGQVNFNEHDPLELDPEAWGEYWASCDLQGITLNIGGPMAFYPTEVPLHRRSPSLGDGDLFGDTVRVAKRLGLRVLGRLDPGFVTQELYDAHPDWCLARPDGSPLSISAMLTNLGGHVATALAAEESEPVYLSCLNGPYYSEFLLDVITEVLTSYDIDGIFTNGWPAMQAMPLSAAGICGCPHCAHEWQQANPGRPLPTATDPNDPGWRAWVDFSNDRIEAVQRRFREHVLSVRPDATFLSVAFPAPGSSLRWHRWIDLVDALGIDAQSRRTLGTDGVAPASLWEVGQQSEVLRAVAQGKPMFRFVATYMASAPFQRLASRPPLETRMIMADALAHGERPKWHTLGGRSHDRRWMDGVREFDRWMADNDRYLHNEAPVSDVGILWSPRSVQLESWETAPGPSHREAMRGWYVALAERRIGVDYVHEDLLDDLDRYEVLILPTGLVASDRVLDRIKAYRRQGGAVVAACGALTRDEWGNHRDPLQVAAVLGVRCRDVVGPLVHSYVSLPEAGRSELLDGFDGTDILGGFRWVVPFDLAGGASSAARVEGELIPDSPTNPTHQVFLRPALSDVPIFATSTAEGRFVYLAADVDAEYDRSGYADHGRLLGNAVDLALGSAARDVTVQGEGVIDTRTWRQRSSLTTYLVNLDNPMLHSGVVRALRPVGPFDVRVWVGDRPVAGVRLLRHDVVPEWRLEPDGVLWAHVPLVDDFEVVAVDFAGDGEHP